jgi:hypothetical protein
LMAAIAGYRSRAAAMGRSIERVIAVYEAGWSGFWLARWLIPILRLSDLRLPNRGGRWT